MYCCCGWAAKFPHTLWLLFWLLFGCARCLNRFLFFLFRLATLMGISTAVFEDWECDTNSALLLHISTNVMSVCSRRLAARWNSVCILLSPNSLHVLLLLTRERVLDKKAIFDTWNNAYAVFLLRMNGSCITMLFLNHLFGTFGMSMPE